MYKWGIRHQVLFLALVPTITISLLLAGYFTSTRLQDLEQSFQERGEAIALKLAPTSEYGVFTRNRAILKHLAKTVLIDHDVQSVSFYTEGGEKITHQGEIKTPFILPETPKTRFQSPPIHIREEIETLIFVVPIIGYKELRDDLTQPTQMESHIGWLQLELDTKSIHIRERQILIHTGLIFLLGLAISGLFAFQMGKNVTRPILELAQAVEKIKRGEWNVKIHPSKYEELQILESGLNTMSRSLANAQAELLNQVDTATLNLRRSLETIEFQNIELEDARNTAETASKIKSEFLADMSHEIRTPLNGVMGFLRLLKKTVLNEKQVDYVKIIEKSANNLLAIINDILDFTKIEAGKLNIERTPIDLRECIDEALNLMSPAANEKNIELIRMVYEDVPPKVMGDALRVKQIITNLVNNAIKFTDKGSVTVRVMLEQQTGMSATILISVTDTGMGLSLEEQQSLFQAFNQVKTGVARKSGGSGLGLAICKKLAEQMGGTIGVESAPKQGATFWFTFEVNKWIDRKKSQAVSLEGHELSKFTTFVPILVVDDNPENLKLMTVFLEELGIDVTAVDNGIEAIEIVKQTEFKLIFMDIRMPSMNGIEATAKIRAYEKANNRSPVPIIALTAHAMMSERQGLLDVGIDDCLTKPIDELSLKSLIYHWTQRRHDEKIVDWDLASKLAGGKTDLAKELFQKLLESLPKEKEDINRAYILKDFEAMRDHVHHLHGGCCYCGVPILKRCAQSLETALASRTLEIIKTRLESLNKAIDDVLAYELSELA